MLELRESLIAFSIASKRSLRSAFSVSCSSLSVSSVSCSRSSVSFSCSSSSSFSRSSLPQSLPFWISSSGTSRPRVSYAFTISSSVMFFFFDITLIFLIKLKIFSAFEILIPAMSQNSLSITSDFVKIFGYPSTLSRFNAAPLSVSNAFSSSFSDSCSSSRSSSS